MKVTKVPGFGRFGCYVDDFEYDSIEAWKELQDLNLKTLLTIVRGGGVDRFKHIYQNMPFFGRTRFTKYKSSNVETADLRRRWGIFNEESGRNYHGWHRVSGMKDQNGKSLGGLDTKDVGWHSDGSGKYEFEPCVALYGRRGMLNSKTAFIQFTDWFENQTEAFKSELREMRVLHEYIPVSSMFKGLEEDEEEVVRLGFTGDMSDTDREMPLVIHSPGGIEGLHFTPNSLTKFQGMSKIDSDNLIARLNKELYIDEYQYHHWWENDIGDLLLFDTSITVHMRAFDERFDVKNILRNREAWRAAVDYTGYEDYDPFSGLEPYSTAKKRKWIESDSVNNNSFNFYIKDVLDILPLEKRKEYLLNIPNPYHTEVQSDQWVKDILTLD